MNEFIAISLPYQILYEPRFGNCSTNMFDGPPFMSKDLSIIKKCRFVSTSFLVAAVDYDS